MSSGCLQDVFRITDSVYRRTDGWTVYLLFIGASTEDLQLTTANNAEARRRVGWLWQRNQRTQSGITGASVGVQTYQSQVNALSWINLLNDMPRHIECSNRRRRRRVFAPSTLETHLWLSEFRPLPLYPNPITSLMKGKEMMRAWMRASWGDALSWSLMLAERNSLLSRGHLPDFPQPGSENWLGLRVSGPHFVDTVPIWTDMMFQQNFGILRWVSSWGNVGVFFRQESRKFYLNTRHIQNWDW